MKTGISMKVKPEVSCFLNLAHFKDRHSNLIKPQLLNDTYIDKPILKKE